MAGMEALWAAHDRRLREVLARLGGAIDADIRGEVEYMLSHREYGVALEGLSSHLERHAVRVDSATRALLDALASDMADDSD
jgi:hypothetical protein